MRLGCALSAVLFVPLAVLADDPPAGWKEVSGGYKNEAYKVWLPTDGKIDDKESNIVGGGFGQIRVFRTVCKRNDGALYAVGQINLPPQLVKEKPKVRQDFFLKVFLDEFNGKLKETKNVKLDTM